MGISITVIGGASSYTPELFAELTDHPEWPQPERVVLMDLNAEKLEFIAQVCKRLLKARAGNTELITTTDRQSALEGADFVILQVRVGGLNARIRDEKLPTDFGIVGNETTGPGGFICALRTVPVAMEVARDMERFCPDAWLFNLSNPAGIVTEALLKYSGIRSVGFCNIPINTTYDLAELIECRPEELELDSFGLNHLSWVRATRYRGVDELESLIEEAVDRESRLYRAGLVEDLLEPEWLQALGMIPSWYLRYYYFPDLIFEADQQKEHFRGEEDMLSEERLYEIYTTEGYGSSARAILKQKGGAQYYLPVLQTLDAILNDRQSVIVVDARNGEAMPDLPSDVCIEVPCRIGRSGLEPVPVGSMPLTVRGLVQTVKAYESLTVEAALAGSRQLALAALMVHPLVTSFAQAEGFFSSALGAEQPYLHPSFYPTI